jgi:hypothetical protein
MLERLTANRLPELAKPVLAARLLGSALASGCEFFTLGGNLKPAKYRADCFSLRGKWCS